MDAGGKVSTTWIVTFSDFVEKLQDLDYIVIVGFIGTELARKRDDHRSTLPTAAILKYLATAMIQSVPLDSNRK